LGAGGMGEVYRARDRRLQRDVAIKVLPEHLADDRDRLARLEREAQMLAALNHPHIAQIYGLEQSAGARALVLELVEGETLAALIAGRPEGRPLPLDEAISIAKQIAQALEAAHEQGIVHRDLKPANVKITPAGVVKVLDFGLAKLADAASSPGSASSMSLSPTLTSPVLLRPDAAGAGVTGVGAILGTAAYMAPEQARGRAADKRSDVWAFGCVLYEMLTGRRAFQGEDVTDTLAAVLKSPPDWTALPPGVPPAIRTLLQRCLERDRAARVGDIAVARFALEEARSLGDSTIVHPDQATSRPRRSVGRLLGIAAIALAAVGAIAPVATYWLSESPPPRVSRFEVIPMESQLLVEPAGVNIALAPDGSTLVYHAEIAGVPQLLMRRIGELDPTPIRGTELALNPAISPDGTRLVFTAPKQMKVISLAGGPPTVIAELEGAVQGTTWVGDTIVFGMSGYGLFKVPAAGGRPENIAKPDEAAQETDYRWPAAVPGTDVVLYTVYGSGGPRQARIVARHLETGVTKVVVEGGNAPIYTKSGHLLYAVIPATLMAAPFDVGSLSLTRPAAPVLEGFAVVKGTGSVNLAVAEDGTLAYSRGQGGVFQGGAGFQWVSRAGKPLEAVASNVSGPRYPRISPDGHWLVVTIGAANQGQLWVIDLTGSSQPRQLTFKAHNVMPIWSADGKSIAFTSDRAGQRNLFRIAADGSELEPTPLATSRNEQSPSAWSVDGQTLLYEEGFSSSGDLMMFSLADGKSSPWLKTDFEEADASLSPNGRWVAYVSDQTGRFEVWVRPFPGPGAPVRVSSDGGAEPQWARNGTELFYQSGRKMMAAGVSYGDSTIEFKPSQVLFEGGFVPHDGNVPRTYDVAKDGRFLMIREAPQVRPRTLVLVLNWFEELKRQAPTN
ncbi:MAG TPA: protein kinase, partial [Vicinamibacterales bacterium]|nr:protein kinase [Vicinamibacterales bacterium]